MVVVTVSASWSQGHYYPCTGTSNSMGTSTSMALVLGTITRVVVFSFLGGFALKLLPKPTLKPKGASTTNSRTSTSAAGTISSARCD